jgi:hypothetical protein
MGDSLESQYQSKRQKTVDEWFNKRNKENISSSIFTPPSAGNNIVSTKRISLTFDENNAVGKKAGNDFHEDRYNDDEDEDSDYDNDEDYSNSEDGSYYEDEEEEEERDEGDEDDSSESSIDDVEMNNCNPKQSKLLSLLVDSNLIYFNQLFLLKIVIKKEKDKL